MNTKTIFEIYDDVLSKRLKRFPLQTWDQADSRDTFIKLMRYLVQDKLNWDRSMFCSHFCLAIISTYRLNGGFGRLYQRNIYPMITECFPEWNIRAWEMKKSRVPEGFWTIKHSIEATTWLVEEVLQWDYEKVSREISNSAFHEHNLGGLLRIRNANAVDMIIEAYPKHDWSYLKEREGYRITPKQAARIKELHGKGYNQRELSKMFQCDPVSIFNIVHKKTHQHYDVFFRF